MSGCSTRIYVEYRKTVEKEKFIMRNFKFFLSLSWLIISCQGVYAQDIKLRVVSGSEILPYSFIYINGEAYGAADAEGFFSIPSKMLNKNDTISASYAGFKGERIVYNGNAEEERVIDLEAQYDLDEVIVATKKVDMFKIIKKYMNFPRYIYEIHIS